MEKKYKSSLCLALVVGLVIASTFYPTQIIWPSRNSRNYFVVGRRVRFSKKFTWKKYKESDDLEFYEILVHG
ncbi:unnamed protein product, partial [marine sediment metagenome]